MSLMGTSSYTHIYAPDGSLEFCSEAETLVPGEWAECPHTDDPMYRELIWLPTAAREALAAIEKALRGEK